MTGWCPYIDGTLKEAECHHDGYCSDCPYKKDDDKKEFIMDELLEEIESLRIDVDVESFGKSRTEIEKYQRANEMLDDCISIIRDFVTKSKL